MDRGAGNTRAFVPVYLFCARQRKKDTQKEEEYRSAEGRMPTA
jgi:hypothetical protein